MSATEGTDLADRVIGRHPFPVRIIFGDRRVRAFVPDTHGNFLAPGIQIVTNASRVSLAASGRADTVQLSKCLEKLGLELRFLLNLATQNDSGQYLERLQGVVAAAGRARLGDDDLRDATAVKAAVDEAGMLGPQAILNAAMTHLAAANGTGRSYGTLLDYINHLLTNRGRNPRIRQTYPPVSGLDDIGEDGIDLWWFKEGSATVVIQVHVPLKGNRPPLRFILNVAKDLTAAADELRRTHADFLEFYGMDPAYVMEPLGMGTATVRNWRGVCPAPVLAAEWFDGHELHVYESGPQLYVWLNQEMSRDHPVPQGESDRVWKEMIRICARYTRRTPAGLLPVGMHVNAGDFIFREGADGRWEVLLIWIRQPPVRVHADEFLVVKALLSGVNAFGTDRGSTVWWDNPRLAIEGLREGLAQAGLGDAQITALFKSAYYGPFTEFAQHPERTPHLPEIGQHEHEGMRRVFDRARRALGEYLRVPGEGLPGLPS